MKKDAVKLANQPKIDKKPKHIYCLEPSNNEFQTLQTNLDKFDNITLIKKGI